MDYETGLYNHCYNCTAEFLWDKSNICPYCGCGCCEASLVWRGPVTIHNYLPVTINLVNNSGEVQTFPSEGIMLVEKSITSSDLLPENDLLTNKVVYNKIVGAPEFLEAGHVYIVSEMVARMISKNSKYAEYFFYPENFVLNDIANIIECTGLCHF